MRERGVKVTALIVGQAASMGSVILMAGDVRQMTHGSRVMIHEASTMAYGDARVMRKNAELLEGISSELAGIYADRTGGDVKAIRNLMLAETWMTADEAKGYGFVQSVLKDGKVKAENAAEFDIRAENTTSIGMSLLSKLFPGNDEVSKLEASILENDSLRADLTAANDRITELSSLSEANATLQKETAEFTAKITTLEGEIVNFTAQIATLKTEVETAKASAGKTATEMLAAVGQPEPLPIDGNETKGSTDKPLSGLARVAAAFAKKTK